MYKKNCTLKPFKIQPLINRVLDFRGNFYSLFKEDGSIRVASYRIKTKNLDLSLNF